MLSRAGFQRQMPITEVDWLAELYEVMRLKECWPIYEPIDKNQLKPIPNHSASAGGWQLAVGDQKIYL